MPAAARGRLPSFGVRQLPKSLLNDTFSGTAGIDPGHFTRGFSTIPSEKVPPKESPPEDGDSDAVDPRVWPIAASTFVTGSAIGVALPVMPLFAAELGLSTAEFGLVGSVFGATRLLSNLPLVSTDTTLNICVLGDCYWISARSMCPTGSCCGPPWSTSLSDFRPSCNRSVNDWHWSSDHAAGSPCVPNNDRHWWVGTDDWGSAVPCRHQQASESSPYAGPYICGLLRGRFCGAGHWRPTRPAVWCLYMLLLCRQVWSSFDQNVDLSYFHIGPSDWLVGWLTD